MVKSLYLTVLAGLGVATLLSSPARAQLPAGGPWGLRFSDEFDEAYAGNITGLDPDKWSPAYPWGRTHNYPAYIRDENILVNTNDNGLLQLWGKRENFGGQPFTSGAVNSNGKLNLNLTAQSGYMEARMRFPRFTGAWPAFWSLQEGWPPEIDMMEFVLGGPNTSRNNYVANVHFRNAGGENASSWSGFKDAGAGDLTAGFHNYGLRWTDNTLTWYVDGRQFHNYTGADAIAQMQRMYLILNLGIGGWPGNPPAGEDINKSFDIDWVRVWQTSDPAQSNYVGPAGGNQNWDDNARWTSGAPKLGSTTAFFGNLSGGTSVTLDWLDTKTVGGLVFRTGSNYRIGWADDQLMLSAWDSGSSATEALIDLQVAPGVAAQGTQTIASRVELFSNTRVRNATSNSLTFLSDIHGAGGLTLESGKTSFNGAVFHRGGTHVVGSADASFGGRLGTSDSVIHVGAAVGSNATLRLLPTSTAVAASQLRIGDLGGAGTLVQSGGNVTVTGGEVWVGQGGGSTGTYDHSAGSLTLGNWLAVGRADGTGTYRIGGSASLTKIGAGNLILGSLGGTGTFTQTGGTVTVQSGNTLLGEDAGAAGTYTISGGTATLRDIVLSQRDAGGGTFNLDGGAVTATRVGRAGTGTATFNFNGGTLKPAGDSSTFMQGLSAGYIRGGGAVIDTDGRNVTIAQPLLDGGGSGGLAKRGAGTLTLAGANTYTGATSATAGVLAFAASQRLSSLSVGSGATAALTPGGGKVLVTGPLTIAGSTGAWVGKVDIADNALAVDWSPSTGSPIGVVADQVKSARAGGAWSGNGITSSHVVGNPYAVGFAESAAVLGPGGGSFFGHPVDGSAVLVRRTLYGDANIDGSVNGSDFALLAGNFGRSGVTWPAGDFNYDGSVNGSDFALLAGNFGRSVPGAAAGPSGVTSSEWLALESFGSEIGVAVPEPASAAAALLVCALLQRRRRP